LPHRALERILQQVAGFDGVLTQPLCHAAEGRFGICQRSLQAYRDHPIGRLHLLGHPPGTVAWALMRSQVHANSIDAVSEEYSQQIAKRPLVVKRAYLHGVDA
jgi:hypothetical protein